ncbi:MAG: serine/threonine protein kinase, partial [Planctomycetota bacterium]|nr:serine/threonine protein kinase [Planctomycetota bacterium]
GGDRGGKVTAKVGDLSASARVRVFPALPWMWDFEGFGDSQVPSTWIRAFKKINPDTVDESRVMRASPGKGKPGHFVLFGPSTMSGYTIQADVRMSEEKRRLPNLGLLNQRYCFVLKGNTSKISLQTWQAHLRLDSEKRFRLDPDVWYTMKLKVTETDDGALVQGKVWERGEDEPAEWSIEVTDPHANTEGSPGIYVYNLANSYFDNIVVSKD